jgi:phosphatidylserine decarboxylase
VGIATYAAAQILRALPRVRISRAVGRLCDQPLPPLVSRAITRAYCHAYRVNIDEASPQPAPYESFDKFFTRTLKQGARNISDDALISPCDGVVSAVGRIDPAARLLVKGQFYEVGELVGDPREAARYAGGDFAVIYLAPRDYHRVHSPVEGEVILVRGMKGDLFPVNAIGERHVPQLFVRNQRAAFVIETKGLGRVTVVMVGAVIVGRITATVMPQHADVPDGLHVISPPSPVAKAGEIGIFHLGSTAVLLLEPGISIARGPGPITLGESLLVNP